MHRLEGRISSDLGWPAVHEHHLFLPAQLQVLIHSLCDAGDFEHRDCAQAPDYQVLVVGSKVVDPEGHLLLLPENHIADLMCCTWIVTPHLVVVHTLQLLKRRWHI